MFKKVVLVCCLFGFLGAGFGVDFKPAVLMNVSMPKITPAATGTTYASFSGPGGGALLGISVAFLFELEAGLLFLPYGYKATVSSLATTSEISWWMLQVPLLFRYKFLGFFSLGVGPYFSIGMGSKGKLKTSGGEIEFALEEAAKSDVGGAFSLALNLPLGSKTSLFVDGRYLMSVKNLTSTVGSTLKINQFQAIGGISLGL